MVKALNLLEAVGPGSGASAGIPIIEAADDPLELKQARRSASGRTLDAGSDEPAPMGLVARGQKHRRVRGGGQ
jgi:hypothetical protein